MKRKIRIALALILVAGLLGTTIHVAAGNYMCARIGGTLQDNYEEVAGGYCGCNNILQNGWAVNCDYVIGGGGSNCTERTCNAVPCCHEMPEEAPN